jgi:hypothetical protein
MLNDDVFVDIEQLHPVLKQMLIIYKAIKEKNFVFFFKIKFQFFLFLFTPIN